MKMRAERGGVKDQTRLRVIILGTEEMIIRVEVKGSVQQQILTMKMSVRATQPIP